jgi:pyruvate/2-oxoglutarate dehydrogenase complex dihydrolipoamide dehydrogenase (E3) component
MMTERVDVVVIGMGVGGEEVAGRLAEAGMTVVGVEGGLVGGECPYWGCVPTKMMVRAAGMIGEVRRAAAVAGTAAIEPDWGLVAARIRAEATDTWDDKVAVDRFVDKGGRFVRGRARITGPGEVTVGDLRFTAGRGVVVATGTTAVAPPIPGLAGLPFWTNREAVQADQPPASLVVIGGGPIGVEFAQVFARFGSEVTVVGSADRLLPGEEPESGEVLRRALEDDGVRVHTGTAVTAVGHDGTGFEVTLADGTRLDAERVLVAAGRRTRLADLGLEAYGVDPHVSVLGVDERLRVADGLWAVGDVTGHGAFTHVAMYQADVAVRDILGAGGPIASYHAVPRVTFTDPEVGSVGLTEARARAAGLDVRVGSSQVPGSARGWIHKLGNEGVVKLVEDVDRGVLVGATAVGPHGGEVLGALSVAVHAEVPTEQLRQMIYAYPTFHRGIEDALRDLREQRVLT